MEERYTQEAVQADQRESGLRQQAENLQEQLKETNHQEAMQRYMYTLYHRCAATHTHTLCVNYTIIVQLRGIV